MLSPSIVVDIAVALNTVMLASAAGLQSVLTNSAKPNFGDDLSELIFDVSKQLAQGSPQSICKSVFVYTFRV